MKIRLLLVVALLAAPPFASAADRAIPTLEKRGPATQLIVDDKPWLILGGELENTASSSPTYMAAAWPGLTKLNVNTALAAVAWAWIEPEEGKFDFTLVDDLLAGARKHRQRLILLWFGSWKNGLSNFAPSWVKADQARFPRVRIAGGRAVEILSPLSEATRDADTRAYVRLLEHLRDHDPERTVIMMQIQNEVGVLGDSRDRSPAAEAAFAAAVPAELTAWLSAHRDHLSPALADRWSAAGAKSAGPWTEVFGPGLATDELFMAWHFGRFMGHMAAAGKAAYPLPAFTNTWIVQPEDKGPGDYPSGGPQPLSLDVWKAAAPAIDFSAPDVYLPNFDVHAKAFHRADNPLFIPESFGDAAGVANAFYAIGAHDALGYSPFGIDNLKRLAPDAPKSEPPPALETLPIARGYAVLRDLAPLILAHQAAGTIGGAWLTKDQPTQDVVLGDHILTFALRKDRKTGNFSADAGYALAMALGPDEYLVAGADLQVTFTPRAPGASVAGIADAESGAIKDGRFVADRRMNGDDILVDYDIAKAAEARQSGAGLILPPDGPTIQRVRLYHYQ